ncbi:DUF5805 domain-containing protein [Candidatus Halobonum tyrrellensis]|uniref:Uncharacterized protein n=1 Tax=Candidatus Halobonum tyrrellensis G22 TaxID=1324957 RepID=V4HEK2_9EURY|nr:DUF5805 domain-containing protein [Candidatus Halobonum tyrrellensis]ESP89140.1 hypothetical protein K933_05538 [Candidatus Halobonum tyrrellensis G22]
MSEPDTDRVAVRVSLPAYQKAEWVAEAEAMGMSQAEFVRTMVQAGRHEMGLDESDEETDPAETRSDPTSPGGDGLEDRVHGILRREGPLSWDALLRAVADDFEDRLDDTVAELQASGRVRYSGREGGYVAADE